MFPSSTGRINAADVRVWVKTGALNVQPVVSSSEERARARLLLFSAASDSFSALPTWQRRPGRRRSPRRFCRLKSLETKHKFCGRSPRLAAAQALRAVGWRPVLNPGVLFFFLTPRIHRETFKRGSTGARWGQKQRKIPPQFLQSAEKQVSP